MSETPLFKDKTALITGSGRGIGRAIALHFASQGADVVINFFRNRARAEETAREVEALGRRAHDSRPDHRRGWRLFANDAEVM